MGRPIKDLRLYDFLVGVILLAILYGLARPGSRAAAAIADVSAALIALVSAATGFQATGSAGTPSGGGETV